MFRVLFVAAGAAFLTGCESTLCSLAETNRATCVGESPDAEQQDVECGEETTEYCRAQCFFDGFDEGGCDAVTGGASSGPYLACITACLEAAEVPR